MRKSLGIKAEARIWLFPLPVALSHEGACCDEREGGGE